MMLVRSVVPSAMFGPSAHRTPAVPIAAGGPEHLRIILEGESLLNDASSFTLFSIFVGFVATANESIDGTLEASAGAIIWKILWKMVWLAVGALPQCVRCRVSIDVRWLSCLLRVQMWI